MPIVQSFVTAVGNDYTFGLRKTPQIGTLRPFPSCTPPLDAYGCPSIATLGSFRNCNRDRRRGSRPEVIRNRKARSEGSCGVVGVNGRGPPGLHGAVSEVPRVIHDASIRITGPGAREGYCDGGGA